MSSTLFIDNITKKSDNTLNIMSDGNFVHQNHSTISGTTTIPSGSNSLLVGPTTIATLTVNGNLNVIQSLNVTNELNIVGSISFSG
tara:strand:+ start:2590 stop:2847 length:258 start_codon:yes stop_codon:yes gene_type:complete